MKYIAKENLDIRPSFAMAFAGGEIYFILLDSMSVHTDIVMRKFREDII